MTSYPEHDKLRRVSDKTEAIGDFLEWCAYEKGAQLGQHDGVYFRPAQASQSLMAEWAGIDLDQLEAEKRQMLEEIRQADGG